MKKILTAVIISGLLACSAFCGDVATFVEGGWSKDGNIYVFGQYGKTDKNFQSWAELIEVDIKKNDYADKGYFSVKPSAVTKGKSGREVYESLEAQNFYNLKPLNLTKTKPDQMLYICEDPLKKGSDEIKFTDFLGSDINNPMTYNVKVVPTVNGSGAQAKSSFYILIEKKDKNGNVTASQMVGNPDIKRKGVTGYKVEQILCDKTGKNMIFVVEKIMEDNTGINIRYMVEACELNPEFTR
ncbi:MAG: DUF2259 domain-containing protein [Treponema sp.]|nr:DUF2259 domain-containing protein [Treponema sp.]